jgi:hypothetical protein
MKDINGGFQGLAANAGWLILPQQPLEVFDQRRWFRRFVAYRRASPVGPQGPGEKILTAYSVGIGLRPLR